VPTIDAPSTHGERGPADLAERQAGSDARAPSSDQDTRQGDGPRLTDAEHREHVAEIKDCIAEGKDARLDSHFQYTIDARHEIWSDDRAAAHDALLADLYDRASAVPCEHKAIVAGGLPGAGKTTVVREHAGIDVTQYLVIDPDAIKAEMTHRRLVPEIAGLTPMEATEFVHEEASELAKRLARRAQADGKNVIWDVTMCKVESASDRIESLHASGYRVDGIFVDIPVDLSLQRADARHRQDHEKYRAGEGMGGRFIPAEMITAQADDLWGSRNRASFEQVKDKFDAWSLYDNTGSAPVLVEASGFGRDDDEERAR
jgi:predicted kinase